MGIRSRILLFSLSLVAPLSITLGNAARGSAAEVTDTEYQQLAHSSYVVLRGQLALPSEGTWNVRSASDEAIVQLYRLRPPAVERRQVGRRMHAAISEQRIDAPR